MTPDQIQQFNMLQDVITEFSDNPDEKRSTNGSACSYNPPMNKPLSRGCAIGMYLPTELAIKLDNYSSSSIDHLIEYECRLLPKWLLKMDSVFLVQIQDLHDSDWNWAKKGLSDSGISSVRTICKRYELPFNKLKFNQS